MKEIELIKNGKRIDGRLAEQMREIEMQIDVVSRANGSAQVKFGNTIVVASVYGPKELYPKYLREPETGILRCRYAMAPFSTEDRKTPGPDRRSIELSKVIRIAIEPAIFLEDFPKAVVDIFVEVLQADGSTRVTGINAASLALACAGIPLKDLICACSAGKIDDTLVVDLNGKEDNFSKADMSFAMLPSKDEITLLQMDGLLTKEEVMKLIEIAKRSCKEIYELQKRALREKYKGE
jgi:exosome complex component RRP41